MKPSLQLFRRTHQLQDRIDHFFDNLSEAAAVYNLAIQAYFKGGLNKEFETRLERVKKIETNSDMLRREIENELYLHTLIPDSRTNVLELVERVDALLSIFDHSLWAFLNERPSIPSEFHADYIELTKRVIKSVDELCRSCRAFFLNPDKVPAYNHKVMLYEKEADVISTKLKKAIFSSDIDLANKLYLRIIVEQIDDIANQSEDIADRLAIYAIQRIV